MRPESEMAQLSERLAVMNEPQDWGIVNGDPARLDDFVEFYESQPLSSVQRAAMVGLVLASANARLQADRAADLDVVARLLPRFAADAEWEYDYWRGLDGAAFPLAEWLRCHPL
jgi:hypothetical protein